jgi:RNA polymerase sigma-70 factor (ECF subfamily)
MARPPTQPEGAPEASAVARGRGHQVAAIPSKPSFREIHDQYFGFVWRYAANRRVPPMAIDDVVQEVFFVVYNRLASFEGRSSLRTWLAGIAHNVVRGYLRKPGNRAAGDYLDDEEQLLAHDVSPAEALERKSALELLDRMLDKMSDVQREVFILCEIEQLSGVEIAEVLGVNENTVRTRLLAARKIFNAGVARSQASQKWGKPLRPPARQIVEMARAARTPNDRHRDRAYQALMAGLSGAAALGTANAAASVAAKSSLAWLKWALPGVVLASAGIGGYWWSSQARVAEAPKAHVARATSAAAPSNLPLEAASIVPPTIPPPTPSVAPETETAARLPSAPKNAGDKLVQELSLLHQALAASQSGNAARALELARDHARRYPNSRLAVERSAIEVRSLCSLGRPTEARKVAERLRSQAPGSPVSAALKDTCVGK